MSPTENEDDLVVDPERVPTERVKASAVPDLSLVVALYFEEECVGEFIRRVREELDGSKLAYEIVFVDDGSEDRTVPIVEEYARQDERIKLVQLSRNHGKEAAVTAGIAHARGDWMVMMDPDLQDPPDRILDFLDRAREGYDLVFGVRRQRRDTPLTVLFSKLFWAFLNGLTGLAIPKNLAVMRIFSRRFAEEFLRYPERVRFIEGIFMSIGMPKTTLEVENHRRFAGVSKFGFRRKVKIAHNAIIAFSDRPIDLLVGFGLTVVTACLAFGSYALLRKLAWGVVLGGWTSLILAVITFGGLQLVMLGLIGSYVGRVYTEVKRRPVYTVHRRINTGNEPPR